MKAFSSNISVTILNRRQYDKNLSNDLNKVFFPNEFFILNSNPFVYLRHGMSHKNIFACTYFVIKFNIE